MPINLAPSSKPSIYQSTITPQNRLNSPGPATQSPVQRQESQTSRLLQQGAAAVNAYAEMEQRKEEARLATDLVDSEVRYGDALLQFEADWKKDNARDKARKAPEAWDEFNRKLYDEEAKRFVSNPKAGRVWLQTATQMRQSSIRRAFSYADSEDNVYRQETSDALISTYTQKVSALHGDDVAIDNLARQTKLKLKAINPGMDTTSLFAKMDLQTATTRINTAVAMKDTKEAKRLLNEYKGVLGTSFDEMVNHVEASSKVDAQERGTQWATDQFNAGRPDTQVFAEINKMKDPDEQRAARYQYDSMWSMQAKIQEKAYQDSIIAVTNKMDSIPLQNVAEMQALVSSMPQDTNKQLQAKQWAQNRVDAVKAGMGIDKPSDAASYMGIQQDILSGSLLTKEQVAADPRAAKLTRRGLLDLQNQLVDAQKVTNTQIHEAFKQSFGAAEWEKMVKSKDKSTIDQVFKYLQLVKTNLQETNRAQDTDYIQKLTDTLALTGERNTGRFDQFFSAGYGTDTGLGQALSVGDFSFQDLYDSIPTGKSLWLVDTDQIPATFQKEFEEDFVKEDRSAWKKLYGEKAVRAAYTKKLLLDLRSKQGVQ